MKFKLKEKVFFKDNMSKDHYGFIVGCEFYSKDYFLCQSIKQRLYNMTELKYYVLVNTIGGTTVEIFHEQELLKRSELDNER